MRQTLGSGLLFFPGNPLIPRNYPANVYAFRQNSQLLYLCGISRPGIALVLFPEEGRDVLYGPPEDLDDLVWHGPQVALAEFAEAAGISEFRDIAELGPLICDRKARGQKLRYLPPYHERVLTWMSRITGESQEALRQGSCPELARAAVEQRLIKSAAEIAEIEDALEITREMHLAAMRLARPGLRESEIAAAIQEIALRHDRSQAYLPIVTVRGEVLHNCEYGNLLQDGDLMLNDSGAESPLFYASDITRAFPVNGRFDSQQKDVYEVCLQAQLECIDRIRPGITYREVHLHACRVITEGLAQLGLMTEEARFNPAAAVADGAHALFFPHGLGHALGLDVHDMEDLGDIVGYGGEGLRSDQFGLNFLRFARPLEPGHVMTVEPGIYFIPALIDRWRAEGRHQRWIDYDVVESFQGLGGIRIEDDVLVTAEGSRVLGSPIAKSVAEVEDACAT
ncbi:MAG: aminopeptidase P family protein [Planctomycetes bacterium]|nr:aminopeptidase P family protein [Planctomycetota bacterium]